MLRIYTTKDTTLNQPLDIEYPYTLDPFQITAINCIHKGEDVLVTAHTGSGKTVVAEYGAVHILKNNKKRVIYTTPIKALSNEKFKDLKEKFSVFNISVGILTGDNQINPEADLIIMTAEILRNGLLKIKSAVTELLEDNFIDSIKLVIMDECHYINDLDRGHVWEETLILLNKHVQLILLSATIDKSHEFAQWVCNTRSNNMNLISTSHRVIPLKHYIFTGSKLHEILDDKDNYNGENYKKALDLYVKLSNFDMITKLIEKLKEENLLQAIFFTFSRANCEKYSKLVKKDLITPQESAEIENIFNYHLHKYQKQYETLEQYILLKNLVINGVGFHHSGLLPILKEIVEILFHKGFIKILFATETFAVGVNMPTRTVVFTDLEKYTNKSRRFLNTAEYKQMSGRAGRRGLDTNGTCIILPLYSMPDESNLKNVLINKMPEIKSKMNIDLQFVLRSFNVDKNILNKSLLFKENNEIINSIENEIKTLEEELNQDNNQDNQNQNQNQNQDQIKYFKLEGYIKSGITLNKQQKKDYIALKKIIDSNTNKKNIIEINNKTVKLQELKKQLENQKSWIEYNYNCSLDFLNKIGYISNNELTNRGVIAYNINDCNSLILTELLLEDYLTDLSSAEIVGVLGMFIDDDVKESNTELGVGEIIKDDTPENLEKIYKKVVKLTDTFDNYWNAQKYNIFIDPNYWKLNKKFINIAYKWGSGCGIHETIYDTYEGNFIKNMLKIYNIIQNLKILCEISKKIELIPVLEETDTVILRDIVNVNSIYLN